MSEEEDAKRRQAQSEQLMETARKEMKEADELAKLYWAVRDQLHQCFKPVFGLHRLCRVLLSRMCLPVHP